MKHYGAIPKIQTISNNQEVFEMESEDAANNLKKFMRHTKRQFDSN